MKDICLIIPPSIFLLDERVFPSLGILKVASALEATGKSVDVIDLSGVKNYEDVLRVYFLNNDPTFCGITITTPQMPAAYRIVKAIREINKKVKLIAGGPHPTLVNAAFKRESELSINGRATNAIAQLSDLFDVIVAGDGEYAIFEALKEQKKIIDADVLKDSLFMTNSMYESTPWPARHLIDLKSYKYSIENHKSTSLISQLGCPFACTFCGGRQSPMLRKTRLRSSENVVAELESLYKTYGYTGFMFYDDELNVNKNLIQLLNQITDLQSKLGVEFRLRGFVKSELFSDDQARAMYRAGFRWLLTGFESGSERILHNIKKKASKDDNTRCVDIAKKNNLKVKALMSIGHAGESDETIDDTKKWLLEVQPEEFDVTIITTYPGTPYYDFAVESSPGIWTYEDDKNGDRLHSYSIDYNQTADYYKGDPNGGYKSYVFTDYLSSERLVERRDELESEVRRKLNIPFNQSAAAINFEHSMGQTGVIPDNILRTTSVKQSKKIVRLNVIR